MAMQQAISFQHFNIVWKVEKNCLLILFKMTIDYETDQPNIQIYLKDPIE